MNASLFDERWEKSRAMKQLVGGKGHSPVGEGDLCRGWQPEPVFVERQNGQFGQRYPFALTELTSWAMTWWTVCS